MVDGQELAGEADRLGQLGGERASDLQGVGCVRAHRMRDDEFRWRDACRDTGGSIERRNDTGHRDECRVGRGVAVRVRE